MKDNDQFEKWLNEHRVSLAVKFGFEVAGKEVEINKENFESWANLIWLDKKLEELEEN